MGFEQDESARQAKILRYWRAVEYFSPPTVRAVDDRNLMFRVKHGESLPWESGKLEGRKRKKNGVWRHTVYAGVFRIAQVRSVL